MPGESSSVAAWSGRLTPASVRDGLIPRADDPRLGEFVEPWSGDLAALRRGRPVLVGFPQDEGVRRNGGRVGAAGAPSAIRHWLARLVPVDLASEADLGALDLLDLGDLIVDADLEASQALLGYVVSVLLCRECVPIILGGGHETAFGTYLGHVAAGLAPAVINLDAHLDVRPLLDGHGHSGSPFSQMLDHPTQPLPGSRYAALGVQPAATSRVHAEYVRSRGGKIVWSHEVEGQLSHVFHHVRERFGAGPIHVSLDADVVRAADVPGVSAPAPLGLCGTDVADLARHIGQTRAVRSFELVEINPRFDLDGRSVRWAALVVWHFLAGLAQRDALV